VTARDPITVSLLGTPVPFARMRLSRGGTHYVPPEQRNAAAALRLAAAEAMHHGGHAVLDEPLSLHLLAEFPVPASWSKKKRARAILGEIRPAGRPDIDNLYKLAADAMNGVVYRDDALIVECWLRKIYGVQPKLVCTVAPIFAPTAVKPRANAAPRPGELPLGAAP
jgi:Holliday junction resolvase RusA-like endonuclease